MVASALDPLVLLPHSPPTVPDRFVRRPLADPASAAGQKTDVALPRSVVAVLARLFLAVTLLILPILVPAGAGPWAARADEQPAQAGEEVRKPENPQARLDGWKVEIDQIAAGTQRDTLSDRQLADLRARAESVRGRTQELIGQIQPSVEAIEARLKQLGPGQKEPKEGEPAPAPESDAVKQDREVQNKALAELQGYVKQASLIQLKADEIIKTIGDRRRDRFTKVLMERTRSILDPKLWGEAIAAIPGTVNATWFLLRDWVGLITSQSSHVGALLLGLAIVFFGVLARPVRKRLVTGTERSLAVADPTPLQKSTAAAGIVFFNTVLPTIGLVAIYAVLTIFELKPDSIDQAFRGLASAILLAAAVTSLALGILAPGKPQWRLLMVTDTAAAKLTRLFAFLGLTFGLGVLLVRLMPVLAAPFSLVIAVSGFFALVDIALMIVALRTVAASLAASEEAMETAGPHTEPVTGSERTHSLLWRWLVPIAWIAALAGVGAALVGYVSLARFIGTQMIWTGLNVALLYVLLILIDEALVATFKRDTSVGDSLIKSMGFSRETVEQIGVVMSGVGRLLMIGLVTLSILWPLGYSSEDLLGDAKAAFFGFKIGGLTISLSAILAAVATFVAALLVTRSIQNWLGNRFLPRTRLDTGLKNSIQTAFGYTGTIIAGMLAFSAIGIGLENVAIVAGALSVGIGFGLQSIVNNFVSGLILLAERPIKAGDLVAIGPDKGFVRKINVRSTEIETFDRASLIVPNSSLISGSVKNWMHRDLTGRATVNVGVAYDADPEAVRRILLDAARNHRLVMAFPAPSAFFTDFGESALMFRLVCTVPNVNDAFEVESDLRFEIVKRLRSTGIDIPYAQRDLHIAQLDDLKSLADAFLRAPREPGGSGA